MIGEENIEKWTEQAKVFSQFGNTVKDVCEYLTRHLNLYLTLVYRECYDQAEKVRKSMEPYGGMFRVVNKGFLEDCKFPNNYSIPREQGVQLGDFITNEWSSKVRGYNIEGEPNYTVINY